MRDPRALIDTANLATLKDFPARVALVDMAWGAAISAVAGAAALYAAEALPGGD